MAISIDEECAWNNISISGFFDRVNDQLDPCLSAFKRVVLIRSDYNKKNKIIYNLELADKLSFKIDLLLINKNHFDDFRKLYKDKDANFKIENLKLYYCESNISIEDIEFINQISPKMITIQENIRTPKSIKALALLNWTNVDLEFSFKINKSFYLWFKNISIQLFDYKTDQIFTFKWGSIKIFIEKNKIKNVKFLKANTANFLFIPLESIDCISCSGFKEVLSAEDINKQFANLCAQHQLDNNGLIIPMGYSSRIFIEFDNEDFDYLNKIEDINKIFKEKHIKLKIRNLDRLLEIKKLLPDDFYRINFKYFNYRFTKIAEYSASEIIDNPNLSNLKFIEIFSGILSPNEFQFWWKMLRSKSTRLNVTHINLYFSLLSECLAVLSLCSGCPELISVELKYWEADVENEDEIIENAEREFRQKFGFIQELDIWKY